MAELTDCFRLHKIFIIIGGLSIIQAALPDLSQYGVFNAYMISEDKKYPTMIISGLVSATTKDVNPEVDKNLCMREHGGEEVCFPVGPIVEFDELGDVILYNVKIQPGLSLFLSLFNTSHNRQCQSLSINHAPIPMTVKIDGSIECSGCQHLDVVVCMYECMGLLHHGEVLLPYSKLLYAAETLVGDDKDPQLFQEEPKMLDTLRSGGNNTANDISPFCKDTVLSTTLEDIYKHYETDAKKRNGEHGDDKDDEDEEYDTHVTEYTYQPAKPSQETYGIYSTDHHNHQNTYGYDVGHDVHNYVGYQNGHNLYSGIYDNFHNAYGNGYRGFSNFYGYPTTSGLYDSHSSKHHHSGDKEKDLTDLLEIASTALAFLSFGMFIIHVIMCVSSISNNATTVVTMMPMSMGPSAPESTAGGMTGGGMPGNGGMTMTGTGGGGQSGGMTGTGAAGTMPATGQGGGMTGTGEAGAMPATGQGNGMTSTGAADTMPATGQEGSMTSTGTGAAGTMPATGQDGGMTSTGGDNTMPGGTTTGTDGGMMTGTGGDGTPTGAEGGDTMTSTGNDGTVPDDATGAGGTMPGTDTTGAGSDSNQGGDMTGTGDGAGSTMPGTSPGGDNAMPSTSNGMTSDGNDESDNDGMPSTGTDGTSTGDGSGDNGSVAGTSTGADGANAGDGMTSDGMTGTGNGGMTGGDSMTGTGRGMTGTGMDIGVPRNGDGSMSNAEEGGHKTANGENDSMTAAEAIEDGGIRDNLNFRFKRNTKQPPNTNYALNELSRRIILSIEAALIANSDDGMCMKKVLCENNKYSRTLKTRSKIWIPVWSLGMSWLSGKMIRNIAPATSMLDSLKASILGLGNANCEVIYQDCKLNEERKKRRRRK
ncbi:hypothetical protein Trydic_g19160 [Trypoxylus dichotomus]